MEYLSEPSLNSELILINNSKLLKNNPELYNNTYIEKIMNLRTEYEKLVTNDSLGLQKIKRKLRDEIRELSLKTFVDRDTNLFGEMILLIMEKILTRPNFRYYNYKNEMKSLAVEYILKYTWKFDPNKRSKINNQYVSAFAYLSTIIFNAFVATINKYEKEKEKVKEDFLETQKMFHLDHKQSTYEKDYSEPKKNVIFNSINSSLFELIKQIILDVDNIQIYYPNDYLISLEEYEKIKGYSKENNVLLSISPISKNNE